jgi:hypothetical protein
MNPEDKGVDKKMDLRSEWYAEFDVYAASINRPPRIYWLGMILSVIWLICYLIIYPSIPMVTSYGYWQGLGVPGGCQPWTAICELQKSKEELDSSSALRGVGGNSFGDRLSARRPNPRH